MRIFWEKYLFSRHFSTAGQSNYVIFYFSFCLLLILFQTPVFCATFYYTFSSENILRRVEQFSVWKKRIFDLASPKLWHAILVDLLLSSLGLYAFSNFATDFEVVFSNKNNVQENCFKNVLMMFEYFLKCTHISCF